MQMITQRQSKQSIVILIALFILGACNPPAEPIVDEERDNTANGNDTIASGVETSEATVTLPPKPTDTAVPLPTNTPEPTPTLPIAVPATTEDNILTEDDRSEQLQFITQSWNTNWNRHTIDYNEILSGGPPRDGIPSIDEPRYIRPDEATDWLADNEPVIFIEIEGFNRAYPLQILTWHEIVNTQIGDRYVLVTFCPLCNSALAFDRVIDGEVFAFGTSGLLRNSDLIMYDRTTESLWQQFTGEGIVGDMAGRQLTFLPSAIISFGEYREAFPDGLVLSRDTGFGENYAQRYGVNPYAGYDTIGRTPFLFDGELDGRLQAMERVVTVSLEDIDIAYPLITLSDLGVINDTQASQDLVVFHTDGTSSALGDQIIANAEDIGATGVFDPNLDGQKLTFHEEDSHIIDDQTGSRWNIIGQAIEGPLAGQQLTAIIHGDHFWFSWAAFKPDTIIYQQES